MPGVILSAIFPTWFKQGHKPGGKFEGGGRRQTAFGSKLLTRKTGRVETSDTVQDKNKNVYIITGQLLKLKHAPYLGVTWRITVPPFDILGGRVSPPRPPRDLRPWVEVYSAVTVQRRLSIRKKSDFWQKSSMYLMQLSEKYDHHSMEASWRHWNGWCWCWVKST